MLKTDGRVLFAREIEPPQFDFSANTLWATPTTMGYSQ
jgi:hypothetical protein